jgi:hypothetical protein
MPGFPELPARVPVFCKPVATSEPPVRGELPKAYGELELETSDGAVTAGRAGVTELAADCSAEQLVDWRTRVEAPFSHSASLEIAHDDF